MPAEMTLNKKQMEMALSCARATLQQFKKEAAVLRQTPPSQADLDREKDIANLESFIKELESNVGEQVGGFKYFGDITLPNVVTPEKK